MIVIFPVRGYGSLVPVVTAVAYFAAFLIGKGMHVAAPDVVAFRGAVTCLLAGGALWLLDRRLREESGYVSYDAELDMPVVEDEDDNPFLFLPMRAWAVLLTAGGLLWGLVHLFTRG